MTQSVSRLSRISALSRISYRQACCISNKNIHSIRSKSRDSSVRMLSSHASATIPIQTETHLYDRIQDPTTPAPREKELHTHTAMDTSTMTISPDTLFQTCLERNDLSSAIRIALESGTPIPLPIFQSLIESASAPYTSSQVKKWVQLIESMFLPEYEDDAGLFTSQHAVAVGERLIYWRDERLSQRLLSLSNEESSTPELLFLRHCADVVLRKEVILDGIPQDHPVFLPARIVLFLARCNVLNDSSAATSSKGLASQSQQTFLETAEQISKEGVGLLTNVNLCDETWSSSSYLLHSLLRRTLELHDRNYQQDDTFALHKRLRNVFGKHIKGDTVPETVLTLCDILDGDITRRVLEVSQAATRISKSKKEGEKLVQLSKSLIERWAAFYHAKSRHGNEWRGSETMQSVIELLFVIQKHPKSPVKSLDDIQELFMQFVRKGMKVDPHVYECLTEKWATAYSLCSRPQQLPFSFDVVPHQLYHRCLYSSIALSPPTKSLALTKALTVYDSFRRQGYVPNYNVFKGLYYATRQYPARVGSFTPYTGGDFVQRLMREAGLPQTLDTIQMSLGERIHKVNKFLGPVVQYLADIRWTPKPQDEPGLTRFSCPRHFAPDLQLYEFYFQHLCVMENGARYVLYDLRHSFLADGHSPTTSIWRYWMTSCETLNDPLMAMSLLREWNASVESGSGSGVVAGWDQPTRQMCFELVLTNSVPEPQQLTETDFIKLTKTHPMLVHLSSFESFSEMSHYFDSFKSAVS